MHALPLTSMTVKALEGLDLTRKDAERSKNMFSLGLLSWLYDRPTTGTEAFLVSKFARKPVILEANLTALRAGWAYGETIEGFAVRYTVAPAPSPAGTYRNVTGNTALAYGLVAAAHRAGLRLVLGSYPITPASDILHTLSGLKAHGVTTLQAEDEIGAVGMALGAAYGGALGVTSTSGPGLALKAETIGLAASLELPLVVVDVQRGGPSTGMPTKTEQADLLQAMFGRNGEAPVPVVAPQSPVDCFDAAVEAVRIAITYRTPVLLLSDGYLANGSEPWHVPSVSSLPDLAVEFASRAERRGRQGQARLHAVRARRGHPGPPVGAAGRGRSGAPDRRHREGAHHRRDLVRPRQPRADDAAARREGRRRRGRPTSRSTTRVRPTASDRRSCSSSAGAPPTARSRRRAGSPAARASAWRARTCATSTRSPPTSARCCAATSGSSSPR